MVQLDFQPAYLSLLGDAFSNAGFGARLQAGASLARYTASRLGGPADLLLEVRSGRELEAAVTLAWRNAFPFVLLGGGSNVLVSDAGVRGLVILNRARRVRFDERVEPPTVWAESGANFGVLARQAARRGLSGLEWASGVPGTLGGAVFGNAGAHGGDMAGSLLVAEILHHAGVERDGAIQREEWSVEKMAYSYRSSVLKRGSREVVVLAARLRLERSTHEAVQARIDEFAAYRKRTQPPGASMGSMFKNPPGAFAGRLIEAAGLKGSRIGDAQVSPVHANFFINLGRASAQDFYDLIQLARQQVADRFGVNLELEIKLLGKW